jgi:DNA-binding MarR family transcriptional regulator
VKGNWVNEEDIINAYQKISPPQKALLSALLELGNPSTINTLSSKTGIKRQYVSMLMKKLLQQDLVRKYGRRNALYALTEEGYKLLQPASEKTIARREVVTELRSSERLLRPHSI